MKTQKDALTMGVEIAHILLYNFDVPTEAQITKAVIAAQKATDCGINQLSSIVRADIVEHAAWARENCSVEEVA